MNRQERLIRQQSIAKEFERDAKIIGDQTDTFLSLVYPAYLIDQQKVDGLLDDESTVRLNGMTYFRVGYCTVDTFDKVFESVNAKMEKLLTALHSIGVRIGYGLISRGGVTNLVLGIYSGEDVDSVERIVHGMLSGIELEPYTAEFKNTRASKMNYGILSGVPTLYLQEKKQYFSLSSVMRSLNGRDYTLLFLAKPVSTEEVRQKISNLLAVKDEAFAVSKRNLSRSYSYALGETDGKNVGRNENDLEAMLMPIEGNGIGVALGTAMGMLAGPGGAAIGAMAGGSLGSMIGNIAGRGRSRSEGYSHSIAQTITDGKTVSGDIQNSFAVELMNYAEKAVERLKCGLNNGVWQTAVAYSADSEDSRNIIKACLCGELSKPDPNKLPLLAFEMEDFSDETLKIPDFLGGSSSNALCSCLNSSELGLMCTFPTEGVPDFELRIAKSYPLVRGELDEKPVLIGHVADGKNVLENMPFALGLSDLNKHMFVCGLTGSGKTTTVKKILVEADKPFLVIESAKKEYRNLTGSQNVYTLGRPEIHCPRINPFYIMPGVSPQTHIDYLKDLFHASFSFYGPMPYILEKCLHAIYKNKGWNLTLGCHPMLVNTKSFVDFFDIDYVKEQYKAVSHKYLFPTMQDLKEEAARYIEKELKYDKDVGGNIKTAMKVRFENLCAGAKGFTFNTNEYLDFDQLLNERAVFELEGLADDADKAFSVGLLIIFINEYRQVEKKIDSGEKSGLRHLLVVEEAHRLLKNIETERMGETEGNPKGKAVEHFTNMIAEMRSYGQGVIVAEQIPAKLAPDVIKNSSTKIVQRLVSAEDQRIIANTIGISEEDALQLGTLEAGYAFCHREGMALPTMIKISDKYVDKNGEEQDLDVSVSDTLLFQKYNQDGGKNCFEDINFSVVHETLDGERVIKKRVNALLNTLMTESCEYCVEACKSETDGIASLLLQKDATLMFCDDRAEFIAQYLTELLIGRLIRGVYRSASLPTESFVSDLKELLKDPTDKKVQKVKEGFKKMYSLDSAEFAKQNVAGLVKRFLKADTDIRGTIEEYFVRVSEGTLNEIALAVERGG